MGHSIGRVLCAVTLASCLPAAARAEFETFHFVRVTGNNPEDIGGQLSVEIGDAARAADYGITLTGQQVLFVFRNDVGTGSSISEIYLDAGGSVQSLSAIHNSLGGFTAFTEGASPGNLPGGNTIVPPFEADPQLSVDAQGNPVRGVDAAADALGITFVTTGGYQAVLDAIESGELRIGLHVRSIGAGEGSDSYVNEGGTPLILAVPGPASAVLALGALGSFGLAGWRRRRRLPEDAA